MFPDHIETQVLHGADIEDHGLIAGSCIEALRPVALVQNPVEKVGLIVEKKLRLLFLVQSQGKFPHGEIAVDRVGFGDDLHFIKEGILRTPGAEIRQRNIPDKFALTSGKVLFFHIMAVGVPVPEHADFHVLGLGQRDLQPDRTLIVKGRDL